MDIYIYLSLFNDFNIALISILMAIFICYRNNSIYNFAQPKKDHAYKPLEMLTHIRNIIWANGSEFDQICPSVHKQ